MAAGGTRRGRPMSEINVVPYIDVMLVLLVIFMITAPLMLTGVDVTLPQADAEPEQQHDEEPLILSIDSEGNYYLNVGENPDSAISDDELATLTAAVMRRDPDRRVLVRGDEGVSYQRVVHAMAVMQRAGVPQVGLVAQQP